MNFLISKLNQRITIFTLIFSCFQSLTSLGQQIEVVPKVDSLQISFKEFEKTDLEKAEQVARKALEISTQYEYKKGWGDALSDLGVIHLRRGDYRKSLEFLFSALKIYDLEPELRTTKGYGQALVRIAGVFHFESDYNQSLVYSQKAVQIAKETKNTDLLGLAYRVMGEVFRDRGQLDSASHFFKKGLEAFVLTRDTRQLASIYLDIGICRYLLNDYQDAIKYTIKSQQFTRQTGNKSEYSVGLNNIGEYFYYLKSYTTALKYIDSAQYYNKVTRNLDYLVGGYKTKAKIFKELKNIDSTAFYYEKANALSDSIYNETYKKELAAAQTKLGVLQKDAENKLLAKDKDIAVLYRNLAIAAFAILTGILVFVLANRKLRIQKRVNEALEQSVNERTEELNRTNLRLQLSLNRASVNSHFIFNVLNSIRHVVLQKAPLQASNHLAKLAHLMRYVLEKSHLDSVPLKEEVDMLERYTMLELFRLDDKFRFQIINHAHDEIKIPAMLIQPYVENAILHGLTPAEGDDLRLLLRFSEHNDELLVQIEDNGIGRTANKQASQHVSFGSSLSAERLQILSRLYNKEFGVATCDLHEGALGRKGTKVVLSLPIAYTMGMDEI